MKTILVFLALLLGTVLNAYSGEIGADSVNKWFPYKVEGNSLDTAYIFSTNEGVIEGNTSMAIVYSVDGPPSKALWGKKFDKKYKTPNFVLTMKVKLVELYRDSNFYPAMEIFAGKSENPSRLYKMGQVTIDRRSLGQVTYMPPQFDTVAIKELDSMDFVVIGVKNWLNQNGGAKFIVDELTLFYGKPGDYTFEIIDRFGDPDPTPIFEISRKNIDFGKVMAGIMKTDTVRIKNTGDADLILSEVRTNNPNFSVILSAMTIGPKSSTDIVVNFIQDSVKGKKEGLLIIKHNGTEKIDTIQLLADFKEPDPVLKAQLSYSPKSADFGTLKINQVSHKDTLVVFKNTGNDTVRGTISVVSVAGKGFSIDNKNLLIAPMDSVMRMVRFAPSENGKVNGLLVITSNSPSSPDTVFLTGVGDKTTGVQDNLNIPKSFSLSQNYPNPFNPSTTIEFSLPKRAFVNLTIYNTLGQVVKTLVSSEMESGTHRIIWKANNIPSGIYFYRLNAGNFVETKKMILMK